MVKNVMTDGMVRKWVRQFNDGRTNVHDEARSGQPSVVNDGLVAKVNEKIHENGWFTLRILCDEFPQISKTVLHEIVTNRLISTGLTFFAFKNRITERTSQSAASAIVLNILKAH
ncbi:hypothetical protein AVEN_243463-1 [Araneus ventricosus]|uniref:Mos1 transposase HTH domain-containing protein n=1 Tax=Araneus ventricosus TaxID=182803 RepID=A0A4Y2PCH6_ARAVE|nr:hypothetical protein AVEN_243463-1 [Araneus ventricosus]